MYIMRYTLPEDKYNILRRPLQYRRLGKERSNLAGYKCPSPKPSLLASEERERDDRGKTCGARYGSTGVKGVFESH